MTKVRDVPELTATVPIGAIVPPGPALAVTEKFAARENDAVILQS
jgi:hypothetical protein